MRPGILLLGTCVEAITGTFNEAQAMRPGIPWLRLAGGPAGGQPSMRPRPCGPGYVVHAELFRQI